MNNSISVSNAIQFLSKRILAEHSDEQKESDLSQLKGCRQLNGNGWPELLEHYQDEILADEFLYPIDSGRYDPLLEKMIADQFIGASKEYLLSMLQKYGCEFKAVTGEIEELLACPCCGYQTLEDKGGFDLCPVCWWTDEGIDNHNADKLSSVNKGLSLICARYYFLLFGISKPERQDLLLNSEPVSKYVQGRKFELHEDGTLIEAGTNWKASVSSCAEYIAPDQPIKS